MKKPPEKKKTPEKKTGRRKPGTSVWKKKQGGRGTNSAPCGRDRWCGGTMYAHSRCRIDSTPNLAGTQSNRPDPNWSDNKSSSRTEGFFPVASARRETRVARRAWAVPAQSAASRAREVFLRRARGPGWAAASRPGALAHGRRTQPAAHRGYFDEFGCGRAQ
jgi:hypothetical protein